MDEKTLRRIFREEIDAWGNESPTINLEREAIATAIRDLVEDDIDGANLRHELFNIAKDIEFGGFEPQEKEDIEINIDIDEMADKSFSEVLSHIDIDKRIIVKRPGKKHAVIISSRIWQGDTRYDDELETTGPVLRLVRDDDE